MYQGIELADRIMMDLKCEESFISVFPLGGNQTEKRTNLKRDLLILSI